MEKPKRKGRPLLIAAAGVAFVSFVQCEPKDHPVGNLRPVENIDSGATIEPVGNLRPVEIDTGAPVVDAGSSTPADAGTPAKDAGATVKDSGTPKIIHPVGNLRPPG
jgi:hypothetical protein